MKKITKLFLVSVVICAGIALLSCEEAKSSIPGSFDGLSYLTTQVEVNAENSVFVTIYDKQETAANYAAKDLSLAKSLQFQIKADSFAAGTYKTDDSTLKSVHGVLNAIINSSKATIAHGISLQAEAAYKAKAAAETVVSSADNVETSSFDQLKHAELVVEAKDGGNFSLKWTLTKQNDEKLTGSYEGAVGAVLAEKIDRGNGANFGYLVANDPGGSTAITRWDVGLYSSLAHKTAYTNAGMGTLTAFDDLYYMTFQLYDAASGGSTGIDAGTYTYSNLSGAQPVNSWKDPQGFLDMDVSTTANTINIGTGLDNDDKATFESRLTTSGYTTTTTTYHQITSGTIEVRRTGEGTDLTYTFIWKFTTSDNKTLYGSYTGKVDATS
jgi:hypothetical protein